METFDYVIVGAGSAGSVLAARPAQGTGDDGLKDSPSTRP